jgi:hypothetical protein
MIERWDRWLVSSTILNGLTHMLITFETTNHLCEPSPWHHGDNDTNIGSILLGVGMEEDATGSLPNHHSWGIRFCILDVHPPWWAWKLTIMVEQERFSWHDTSPQVLLLDSNSGLLDRVFLPWRSGLRDQPSTPEFRQLITHSFIPSAWLWHYLNIPLLHLCRPSQHFLQYHISSKSINTPKMCPHLDIPLVAIFPPLFWEIPTLLWPVPLPYMLYIAYLYIIPVYRTIHKYLVECPRGSDIPSLEALSTHTNSTLDGIHIVGKYS